MREKLLEYIHDFIESTEYCNTKICNPQIEFVDDIKECISVDDPKYAERIKDSPSGIFYISSNNGLYLLIQKSNDLNAMWQTIYHEVIHYYDFNMYSIEMDITDYRKLQDDTFFDYWSEFHAEYLSHKYLYNQYKSAADISILNPVKEADIIMSDIVIFLKNNKYLPAVIDRLVRRYGQYNAFIEVFPDVADMYYERWLFINRYFFTIYKFVSDNNTYELFSSRKSEWEKILRSYER